MKRRTTAKERANGMKCQFCLPKKVTGNSRTPAAPDELLPCPFCGGTGVLIKNNDNVWRVECYDEVEEDTENYCGACTGYWYDTQQEAIAAWNTRAIDRPVTDPATIDPGDPKQEPDEMEKYVGMLCYVIMRRDEFWYPRFLDFIKETIDDYGKYHTGAGSVKRVQYEEVVSRINTILKMYADLAPEDRNEGLISVNNLKGCLAPLTPEAEE